jgi:ACS family hexuronate transporter-like MFS transporter
MTPTDKDSCPAMPTPSDVSAPPHRSSRPWWICGLLLLATMLNYMDRQTLSLTADGIFGEFGRSPFLFGLADSVFAVAFALGALAVGWMADRWSVRWIYPAAVCLWSVAGFATGFAGGWFGLMACRFLLGLSEAGHWPCALRTTQHILPPAQRSLGNGILQSGAAVGAILTPLVVLALAPDLKAEPARWRYPFWVIGGLGIGWVVLWLTTIRRQDLAAPRAQAAAAPGGEGGPRAALLGFLADPRFKVLVVVVVAINIAWHYFRHWLPLVLRDLGYQQEEALWFTSAYYTAADAGSLSVGFATGWLIHRGLAVHRARVLVFTACAVLTTLGVAAALLPPGPLLLGLFLVIGFASLGLFPNYYTFSQELTVRHQGKLTGTLSFLNWIAVALLQALVGALAEWTGYHALGMILASLAPLAAVAALVFFWNEPARKPDARHA